MIIRVVRGRAAAEGAARALAVIVGMLIRATIPGHGWCARSSPAQGIPAAAVHLAPSTTATLATAAEQFWRKAGEHRCNAQASEAS